MKKSGWKGNRSKNQINPSISLYNLEELLHVGRGSGLYLHSCKDILLRYPQIPSSELPGHTCGYRYNKSPTWWCLVSRHRFTYNLFPGMKPALPSEPWPSPFFTWGFPGYRTAPRPGEATCLSLLEKSRLSLLGNFGHSRRDMCSLKYSCSDAFNSVMWLQPWVPSSRTWMTIVLPLVARTTLPCNL